MPVPRITDLFPLSLLRPSDPLSSRIRLHTEFPLSCRPLHLQAVQTGDHNGGLPGHRPHQRPVQCVPRRYRLSGLHNPRMSRSMLSCAVSRRSQLRSQITARIPCTQDPYRCMSQELHMPEFRFPYPQAFRERHQAGLLPYSRYSRLQPLPLRRSPSDLRREPRCSEVSTVLWSMQGSMRPRLLL